MITPNEFKALRISKGLTQKDLAQLVGTTQTTITNIEKGITKNPSIDIAIKIANALGKDVYSLFGDETLKNESLKVSENEIDRLKILVFHSLDKYESNQIFLKQFEHDQENSEDWKKFDEYRLYLSEFKKGILEKLIEVGFCTQEDIKEYRAYLYKQANERKFAKKTEMKNEEEYQITQTEEELDKKYNTFAKELAHEIMDNMTTEELIEEGIKLDETLNNMNQSKLDKNKVNK